MRLSVLLLALTACEGGGLLDQSDVFSQGTWQPGPKLLGARGGHTATLLPDQTIAVLGGAAWDSTVSAQICDLSATTCQERGALSRYVESADAVLLPTGRILVGGGWDGPAQLYDPADGAVQDVSDQHATGRLVGLPNGNVFVLAQTSNELYDPINDTWMAVAPSPVLHDTPNLVALADGSVLVSGDCSICPTAHKPAEIFMPGQGWRSIAPMLTARSGHTMTLLRDGRVFVVGGADTDDPIGAEIYDPTNDAWTAVGNRDQNRYGHAAALLEDGRVMVTGGVLQQLEPKTDPTTAIYDPNTGLWEMSSAMPWRQYHPLVALPGDRAIVLGGDTGYMDDRSAD